MISFLFQALICLICLFFILVLLALMLWVLVKLLRVLFPRKFSPSPQRMEDEC